MSWAISESFEGSLPRINGRYVNQKVNIILRQQVCMDSCIKNIIIFPAQDEFLRILGWKYLCEYS